MKPDEYWPKITHFWWQALCRQFFFSQISLTFRFFDLTNLWIGMMSPVVSVSRLSNNLLQIIIVHILLRRIRDDENLSVLHKRFEWAVVSWPFLSLRDSWPLKKKNFKNKYIWNHWYYTDFEGFVEHYSRTLSLSVIEICPWKFLENFYPNQ